MWTLDDNHALLSGACETAAAMVYGLETPGRVWPVAGFRLLQGFDDVTDE